MIEPTRARTARIAISVLLVGAIAVDAARMLQAEQMEDWQFKGLFWLLPTMVSMQYRNRACWWIATFGAASTGLLHGAPFMAGSWTSHDILTVAAPVVALV